MASGVLAYDAGPRLAGVTRHDTDALLHVHVFRADQVEQRDDLPEAGAFRMQSAFSSEATRDHYNRCLEKIHRYLIAGDCYQINFARRFEARFSGDALAAWRQLADAHPAPHSSYFLLPNGDTVFGVSPERFLRIHQRRVLTEPIKGSRPRGKDPAEDKRLANELTGSKKDLAENLMIVDLLRNDLGAICQTGSVRTEQLFELRCFSNVQHLVSSITGELQESVSPLQALLACFPGGSITGAPKKRAMEIIAELEPSPRGFYCGSQFSLTREGSLDSNILIRTFQTRGNNIVCHGGGGIVIDSDTEQEFLESEFKVAALMDALPKQ